MEIKEIDIINIKRLIEGYQYSYLPKDFLLKDIEKNIILIVWKMIEDGETYCYRFKNSLIDLDEKLIAMCSPNFIFNYGAEPICFFDFKKNGTYREIQIPNLVYYIAFIYNSIISFDDIFNEIYLDNNDFIKYSNSYVVFEESFSIHNDYDNFDQNIVQGEFATKNNKTVNQLTSEKRTINYLEKMSSKMYVLKLDIESFYPNIYTHILSQIKNIAPYDDLITKNDYFDFLDKYNMKVNSNQTKGIISGCFASNISSELLMLCVDNKISEYIKNKDIEYIRYVDDLTFFSDSKEDLMSIIGYIQKELNRFKLRINHSKTEICENVLVDNLINFKEIEHDVELFQDIWTNYEDFIQLKCIIKKYSLCFDLVLVY